jgi:hypothetical protein
MKDYKSPWERLQEMPVEEMEPVSRRLEMVSGILTVFLIIAMTYCFVEAIDKEAALEEARAAGRAEARAAMLKANQDILKGQELYVKQLDALIAKEYRGKK